MQEFESPQNAPQRVRYNWAASTGGKVINQVPALQLGANRHAYIFDKVLHPTGELYYSGCCEVVGEYLEAFNQVNALCLRQNAERNFEPHLYVFAQICFCPLWLVVVLPII